MANQAILPDTQQLNCSLVADNVFKLNPLVPVTRANFDLTTYVTTCVFSLMVPSNGLLVGTTVVPPTVTASGEGTTGTTIKITAADMQTFVPGSLGATSWSSYITMTDAGGDTAEVWRGTLTLSANQAEIDATLG
jgi:hypothetical protein